MTTYDYDAYYQTDLKAGAHGSPDQGACLMELTALFAGEQFSDHPKCVSPVLGAFGRGLNDRLPDALRQELKAFIPSLPGTSGDGLDETRGYMALDWLVRTWLPAWLDLVPSCREDARRLRGLGRIVDLVTAERAGPVVRRGQRNADAAVAAEAAAGAAAVAAAGPAGADAARDAARDAAWAAAGLAAQAAAVAAGAAAAGAAAWAAARAFGRAAVGAAVGAAARAAAEVAARDALKPTVEELQRSAIDLYREMIKNPV